MLLLFQFTRKEHTKTMNTLTKDISLPLKFKVKEKLKTDSGILDWSWDENALLTMNGYLSFYAQYLHAGSLFTSLCDDCPLEYKSNNAPQIKDILGTIMLSLLNGHSRYSHMGSLYGDTASAELLGINKIMSHDSVERALKKLEEKDAEIWLQKHLMKTYETLLTQPYILDIDPTVKPVYGNQEAAEIGYNPKKPGRPSQCYHTYIIGKIRLVMDVDVRPGNETAGCHSHHGLWRILDSLSPELRPAFVRGDIGFGNEGTMSGCEQRNVHYLFKVKRTAGVKKLISKLETGFIDWKDSGDGWQGTESILKLQGWSCKRRIIILRRQRGKKINKQKQLLGHPVTSDMHQPELLPAVPVENIPEYDYQILITSMKNLSIATIAQLYRDRADCENVFDEMKNQWGWCGFTTTDLKRTQIMARFNALIYNWWNIFCRLAIPEKHIEAKTSRYILQATVGKIVKTSRKKQIRLTVIGAEKKYVMGAFEKISAFLNSVVSTATQLTKEDKWAAILTEAFKVFLEKIRLKPVSQENQLLLLL